MSLMSFEGGERFRLVRELGAGSFGVVYEAFDRHRHRPVAIKMLERVSPDTLARFKREFRSLAELRHPNLASLYELLVVDERWLFTMELIRGADLLEHLGMSELQHSFLSQPRWTGAALSDVYIERVRDCFRQLAAAVAALHAHGVVHRDVKPSNIMITSEGRVVLLDFGLVVPISLDDSIDRLHVVGTPGYMSPEQMRGRTPTAADDWYSFGVLLYQALTGRLPFAGKNALEILEQQSRAEQPPPSSLVAGIPQELDALCRDLLVPDRDKRPHDGEVLARAGVERPEIFLDERAHPRVNEFIGREKEMRVLRTELRRVQRGATRVVFLHGSPGVGKSALTDHFLDDAREKGAFILGARCHPWESVPLNALDGMVDSLVRSLRHERPPAVDALLGRCVAISKVFPALVPQAPPSIDETMMLPRTGENLVRRAVAELAAVLRAAAGKRPLVILLDDAQWGDFQSASMLSRMLNRISGVLLLISYRSEDWRTSLLLQFLRGVGMPDREIVLRPFGRQTARRWLMRRGHWRAGIIKQLLRDSGGNPMLMEMMMEQGNKPLMEAVEQRLQHVSAAARGVFDLLVVAKTPLAENTVGEMLELFQSDEPLRSLSRQRLIRVRCTGELREIDIYHERMRQERR